MRIGSLVEVRRRGRAPARLSGSSSVELVINGTFSNGMTGWTSIGSATADTSGGTAKIGPLSNTGGFSQDIVVPINTAIDVRVIARKVAGSDSAVWASPSASYANSRNVSSASYQEFYWSLTSSTGVIRIYLQAIAGTGVFEVQSASAKQA